MKYSVILLFLLIAVLNAYQGDYYFFYENLNNESTSALSNCTGQRTFGFLPVDIDDIDVKSKLLISTSMFVLQGGNDYGPSSDITQVENVDFLKHFSIIYNYQKELMPFIALHTPFKQTLDYDNYKEILKKRDALSLGFISELGKHQVISSIDLIRSTFKDADYERYSNGFSSRFMINAKVNSRSSMFLGVVSKTFLQFDDGKEVDDKYKYFNHYEANLGLKYYTKKWFSIYSACYRSYDILYEESEGDQFNYPWLIEHNLIIGSYLNEQITGSIGYELLPSYFTDSTPDIGGVYRHTINAFIGIEMKNVNMNISYSDSKILSEESLGKSIFQMDLIYKIRK